MFPNNERTEKLREKLIDYYGTAIASGMPAAADFVRIETMNDEEIRSEAEKNHIKQTLAAD